MRYINGGRPESSVLYPFILLNPFISRLLRHDNMGIIFSCIGNSQWCLYKTLLKSDWLLKTQSRVTTIFSSIFRKIFATSCVMCKGLYVSFAAAGHLATQLCNIHPNFCNSKTVGAWHVIWYYTLYMFIVTSLTILCTDMIGEVLCNVCHMTRHLCTRPLVVSYRFMSRGVAFALSRWQ